MRLACFHKEPCFDFIRFRYVGYGLSTLLILLSVAAILLGGLRYGVDFAGGVMVQLDFEHPIEGDELKQRLASADFPGLTVQQFGVDKTGWLIRFAQPADTSNERAYPAMSRALQTFDDNPAVILRQETVGPKVGENLRSAALEAFFYVTLLVAVYLSGRFEHRWGLAALMAGCLGCGMFLLGLCGLAMPFRVGICLLLTLVLCAVLRLRFALGALAGLIHDVCVTVGLLALLHRDFDLSVAAALLMLIGYSLNDTIVVYDRIRENLTLAQAGKNAVDMRSVINQSLNQTLSRTLLTSLTTLAACASLLLLGGGVIHDFALTMFIGVLVGTLSSIFVSAPLLLRLNVPAQALPLPGKRTSGTRRGGKSARS